MFRFLFRSACQFNEYCFHQYHAPINNKGHRTAHNYRKFVFYRLNKTLVSLNFPRRKKMLVSEKKDPQRLFS